MEETRPYLIQCMPEPVFRCSLDTDSNFRCPTCDHVLIENYLERDFVGVGIQCFSCQQIAFTPVLEDGEVLSYKVLTLGSAGGFALNRTLECQPDIVITCDQSYAEAIASMAPRDGYSTDLSPDGFASLIAKYDHITGDKFSLQKKIISNTSPPDKLKFPFAWAVNYLQNCILSGAINLNRIDVQISLMWLNLFQECVGSWEHHPRFLRIAKDLGKPNSFLHTASQLIIAKYLIKHGNLVGLSLENNAGEPNPDLYIRGTITGRTFLEIKSPRMLQGVNAAPKDLQNIENTVKRTIKDSAGQINKDRVGGLIIFASLIDKSASVKLVESARSWLEVNGAQRSGLAAIIIASAIGGCTRGPNRSIDQSFGIEFSPFLNPHFVGRNPISLSDQTEPDSRAPLKPDLR